MDGKVVGEWKMQIYVSEQSRPDHARFPLHYPNIEICKEGKPYNNLLFTGSIRNSGFLIWNIVGCCWIKRHYQLSMPTIPLSSLYVMTMYLYMLFDHVFMCSTRSHPSLLSWRKLSKKFTVKLKQAKIGILIVVWADVIQVNVVIMYFKTAADVMCYLCSNIYLL